MAPLTWYHVTQRNIKLIIDRIIKQKRGICGMLSLTHSLTHTHFIQYCYLTLALCIAHARLVCVGRWYMSFNISADGHQFNN